MNKIALFGAAGAIGQSIAKARQIAHPMRARVAGRTMLRLVGLFNPFMREMVEMHYLLTDPVLMDDSALQELLGPIRKTSYPEGIAQCLSAIRGHAHTATSESR